VFATSLALTLGSLPRIIRQVTRSPRATGHALSRSISQIQSGKAASTISAQHSHTVLVIALVVLAGIVLLARRSDRRRKPGFSRAAIPAGRSSLGPGPGPGTGVPSGRPSISGKRR
jgi:hypothetical protein